MAGPGFDFDVRAAAAALVHVASDATSLVPPRPASGGGEWGQFRAFVDVFIDESDSSTGGKRVRACRRLTIAPGLTQLSEGWARKQLAGCLAADVSFCPPPLPLYTPAARLPRFPPLPAWCRSVVLLVCCWCAQEMGKRQFQLLANLDTGFLRLKVLLHPAALHVGRS